MIWRTLGTGVVLVLSLSILLFFAPLFNGRFAFHGWHRVDSCSDAVCDVVNDTALVGAPSAFVAYPSADATRCAYTCRASAESVVRCAVGDDRQRDAWLVWHGDSIARRTYLDMIEMLAGRLLVDLDALASSCRQWAVVNARRKCVHYDHVLELADHRLLRVTFVAKHRVAELCDWSALRHFEGTAWSPSLLVVNSGLWDLLYERNASDYRRTLPDAIAHALASGARAVVWLAIPKLDDAHLPDWKKPSLTDAAIRDLNAATLDALAALREPRLRWLDAYALTDDARADSFGRLPLLGAAERAFLYKTDDGIHRPGPLSRTLAQLQLELTCGHALAPAP